MGFIRYINKTSELNMIGQRTSGVASQYCFRIIIIDDVSYVNNIRVGNFIACSNFNIIMETI